MESLFVLIPLAVIFAGFGIRALFWAIDHHQFDDLDSPAHSILFDEEHASDIDKPTPPTPDSSAHAFVQPPAPKQS